MKKLLFFILAISIHCTANAQNSFSTVEERMSGKDFKETGLGKLTDEELANLNSWLRRHSVATLDNASARPATDAAIAKSTGDLRGFENQPKVDPNGNDSKLIQGNIIGTFDGWNGKDTLFKLTNGMVWQATENDTFFTNPVENAEIEIKKGLMGNWRLSMVGRASAVRVKRVK